MASEDQATTLRSLIDSANHSYASKSYESAAEQYSDATELQAEINGEMNPENADLLYSYGRCLYKVAVSKSDVLGGKVASEETKSKKRKRNAEKTGSSAQKEKGPSEKGLETVAEEEPDASSNKEDTEKSANTAFFQITGDDADWSSDDDDEEDDAADGEGEEQDEEDDLATAYEVLDMARVLLVKKVEMLEDAGKGKGAESSEIRQAREQLADTRDLQAEISLENERFEDAIEDAKASLDLKLELHPKESSLIAEAHFKLSLALEFASTSYLKTDGAPEDATKGQTVDEDKRRESAAHMELAIESSKLRVQKESEKLKDLSGAEAEKAKRQIADVKEMIGEMEQRLQDLVNPAVDMQGITDGTNPLGGLFGSMLGDTPAAQKAKIEEATKTANDLSSLVRHKKKTPVDSSVNAVAPGTNSNGKRAAEDGSSVASKKPKVEDAKD